MTTLDLFSHEQDVSRENFIDYVNQLAQHPDVLKAHKEWETLDQEWKDITKDPASTDQEILEAATKVRESKWKKDTIFDRAALLAERASEKVDVIEPYDKDTIGTCTTIGSVRELSKQWHELRRQGIGGSSISELLGLHWRSHVGYIEYVSQEELETEWLDTAVSKTTEVEHAVIPQKGVLYRGHKWEPALIARYALLNDKRVAVSKSTWKGVYDFQIVNFDGIILDDEGNPEGILECKTSSRDWTWQWGVPIHYRCQALWYLSAVGLKYADVLVKFDSGAFETYRINSDETIDSTSETYRIDHYVPMLEERWATILEYKENPELLWNDFDKLNDELDMGLYVKSPHQKLTGEQVEELKALPAVKIEVKSPYERMDEKFKRITSMQLYKDGKTAVYGAKNVSPIFYDTLGEVYDEKVSSLIDTIGEVDVLVAVDNVTYNVMVSKNVAPQVINASAIKRMVDVSPGAKHFSSVQDFHQWLDNTKNKL